MPRYKDKSYSYTLNLKQRDLELLDSEATKRELSRSEALRAILREWEADRGRPKKEDA